MNEENDRVPASETPRTNKNAPLAALAYIGPLLIIPYLAANNNPFVKFHLKQGLVLLVIEAGIWLLGVFLFFPFFLGLLNLARLAIVVFSIVGIVNVLRGNEKELPLLGQFAKYFTI